MSTDVKIFLSWCHKDAKRKEALLTLLEPRLAILKDWSVSWWEDSHIEIGQDWRRQILRHLDECDYVLQLISPSYLASPFICENEIPPTVGPHPTKPCLPVMLIDVPLDGTQDLHGIDARQIFRNGTIPPVAFGNLTRAHRREDFANNLTKSITTRLSGATQWVRR